MGPTCFPFLFMEGSKAREMLKFKAGVGSEKSERKGIGFREKVAKRHARAWSFGPAGGREDLGRRGVVFQNRCCHGNRYRAPAWAEHLLSSEGQGTVAELHGVGVGRGGMLQVFAG